MWRLLHKEIAHDVTKNRYEGLNNSHYRDTVFDIEKHCKRLAKFAWFPINIECAEVVCEAFE